jgi:hypothetical protein
MAIQSNVTNGAVFFTPVSEIRSACVLARYLDVRFTSAYTMQNVFAERSPWHTPWMARVLQKCKAHGNGISAGGWERRGNGNHGRREVEIVKALAAA